MANLRMVLACAIPALVTTVIGLFWIFIRKKDDDPESDADKTTGKIQRSNDNTSSNADQEDCIYSEQNVFKPSLSDQKTVESKSEQLVRQTTTNVSNQRDNEQGSTALNKNGNASSSYLELNGTGIDSLARDISEKVVSAAIVQHCDENTVDSLTYVTDGGSIKQSHFREGDVSGMIADHNRSARVVSNSDSGIEMPSPETCTFKDSISHESKQMTISEDSTLSHEGSTINAPTLSWSELNACSTDDASNFPNGLRDDPDTAVYWEVMMERSNNSVSQNQPSSQRKPVEDIGSVDESIIASAISTSCSSTPSVFYDNHVPNNSEPLSTSHTLNCHHESRKGAVELSTSHEVNSCHESQKGAVQLSTSHEVNSRHESQNGAVPLSTSHEVNSHHESQNGAVSETPVPAVQLPEHSAIGSETSSGDNNSEASNDSGKGASVNENNNLPQMLQYEVNIPTDLCGLLIGKQGKNINHIKELSGASLTLCNNPFRADYQSCLIEGLQNEVDRALELIRKKFPESKFPEVDLSPTNTATLPVVPGDSPVLMPDVMQLSLPDGVSIDVVVSSIVNAGHVFIQQPTHPTFPSLERLNQVMISCYIQDGTVPQLPRPIEVGVICAAPMLNGWYRAQIMAVCEETGECDIKYVDYGGYARINAAVLRQIRSDFMTLPFQAVECYLGNITPLQGETFFGSEAGAVLEELTQGRLLQAQVVSHADDNVPCIHIYQVMGNKVLFVNRELINRGVVRWIEMLT